MNPLVRTCVSLLTSTILFWAVWSDAHAQVVYGGRAYSSSERSSHQLREIHLSNEQGAALSDSRRSHYQPRCSSDGKAILFLSSPSDSDDPYPQEIWRFDRETGDETLVFKPKLPPPDQIGNFFSAAIQRLLGVSPDGRTVFFTRGNGEVEKVDGKQTRIAFGSDGSSPALPPDGAHLALVGRDSKLRVIEADGKVFRNLGECELPAWSEDSNSLACISKDPSLLTIDVTNAVTSARIALPPPDDHWVFATSIAWNPDDRSLLVGSLGKDSNSTSPYEDYWLVDLTGRNWKYIAAGNDAIWSADGSAIVYSSPRDLAPLPDGKHQEWVTQLKFLEITTLRLHVLVAGLSYNQDAQWCP